MDQCQANKGGDWLERKARDQERRQCTDTENTESGSDDPFDERYSVDERSLRTDYVEILELFKRLFIHVRELRVTDRYNAKEGSLCCFCKKMLGILLSIKASESLDGAILSSRCSN